MESIISLCPSKNRKSLAISQKLRGENIPLVAIYQIQKDNKDKGPQLFRYSETKAHV